MAKKRVHQIAKERGISSKEVLSVLQAAGLDVKAAASSVDENDIAMAFDGGKAAAKDKPEPAEAPAKTAAATKAGGAAKAAKPAATPQPQPPAKPGGTGDAAERPRPTRAARGGEGAPRAAGRRRRVVIDSQASRRNPSRRRSR
jgi:translation initiation factor IF-2